MAQTDKLTEALEYIKERLTEADRLEGVVHKLAIDILDKGKELAEARVVLLGCEWGDGLGKDACPLCHIRKWAQAGQHVPGCRMAKALGREVDGNQD